MAMEDQIGALAELLKGMQSRMDQQHDSLRRTLEANTSALRDLCGKSPATSAATASILASSSDECETEVANSTTASSSRAVTSSSAPLAPSPTPTSFQEATLATNIVPTVPIVNRDDCVREAVVTTNDGKSPTTSATPSASSPPVATPQDVDWAVLVVSSDHSEVTHPNCSTPGLHQVATILVPVTAFSVTSMCTSTSMPLLDVSIANPTAATELILMKHVRCSTSASVPTQNAKLDIPTATAKHLPGQLPGCLSSARGQWASDEKSMTTVAITSISAAVISVFHYISINPVLSIGVHQLCLNTNACNAHELLECKSSRDMLRPRPWPSFSCYQAKPATLSLYNKSHNFISFTNYVPAPAVGAVLSCLGTIPCNANKVSEVIEVMHVSPYALLVNDSDSEGIPQHGVNEVGELVSDQYYTVNYWHGLGSLTPKPPWLLCSEVSVLCHGLQQQQLPPFKGHSIESKSKLLSLPLVISRVLVMHGLLSDWQEQPWPPPVLVEIWSSNTVVQSTPWPSLNCSQVIIRLQCKMAVLQLCASCEPAWSGRWLRPNHSHEKIWKYERHPGICESFATVDTMMEAIKWFRSNYYATLWCLVCNLKVGIMFFTLLGEALSEDALVQLVETVYYSALQILWQESIYTAEDKIASLKLLNGYDIFGLCNVGLSPELMMLNSSDQFFFFSGVTRETATDMECARHSRILVLPYLISDIMTQYAGILLDFIGQPKSTVAATAAMAINPKLHVETLQNRASPEIENVFNDAFWESLDAVVNALDNVTARMYIDSRCVYFQKPLLESGTLGAKCNTQMVIPHLTENYGASRDPPEKQAPMCTVHSFPHNIDHCLTWARSEFEGLLEKTPTEVNAFLSNPSGYATAARTAGDAQARDQLERVIECLETDKCETFQDCITWARLKFEDYFSNRVKQLTFTFPEDAMTSSGAPFWSAPKRFPRPLEFSSSDSSHLNFLLAASILRAETFGIPIPDWAKNPTKLAEAVDKVIVPDFQPKQGVKIETDEKATSLSSASVDDAAVIEELIAKLEAISKTLPPGFHMNPIQFEKDDDTNFHMDLIAGFANMRARNYSIPEVDKLKAKFIAGRIIPAIATSTAMATGLVCLELYKVLAGGHKVEDYRNTFANLAIPLFSMAEPVPPKTIKHQDMSWTVWDRWTVTGNITLRELLEWLKEKGLNAYSISCGTSLLYNSMFPRHKERLDKKVVDVAREVAKVEVPSYRRHLDIVVACEDDDDNDVDIPLVSIYFR